MKIKKTVNDGEVCPKYYARAWYDFELGVCICYPWPFHFFIGLFRYIYLTIRYKFRAPRVKFEYAMHHKYREKFFGFLESNITRGK